MKNSFFHPITKGKLSSDFIIRKSQGHFKEITKRASNA